MTLRARFGLFGHDRQTYLPGTDPALLPDPAGQDALPHPDALAPEPYTPGTDGAENLFDGRVTSSTTRFSTVSARTVFDVVGAWNSVKNVAVASDGAADLAFVGFVHVDAMVGLGSADDSSLEVVGAKRGNLVTGAGNDRVEVRVASNASIWSEEFRIASGAGDDDVRIAPLDVELERRAGDATFADAPVGAGPMAGHSGWTTAVWVDLGDGDDEISFAGRMSAVVDGGAGDDRVTLDCNGTARGGDGRDTLLGSSESDELWGDGGADTVSGGYGNDSLHGGDGDDRITGEALWDSLHGDGGADTLLGGVENDTLAGGEGDDALGGEEGWDIAAYAGRSADYEVAIGSAGGARVVTVRDRNAADGDEGTDTLTSVEHLRFADGTFGVPTLAAGVPGVVFSMRDDWGRGATFWVSDGTVEGTVPFKEIIVPGGYDSAGYPYRWVALGDGRALAPVGTGWDGVDLWITDGNAGNTRRVKAIPAGSADTEIGFTYGPVALGGGKALFAMGDGAGDVQLWTTDGTEVGTSALATATLGDRFAYPYGLVSLGGGRAVFAAGDNVGAMEIWATDGTAAGTARVATVADGTPQNGGYRWRDFLPLGDGRALFAAGDAATGQELWITDGTAAGTEPVKDINPGGGSSYIRGLVALGDGRALISANDAVSGQGLWVTDGTAAGTRLVEDINPGDGSSHIRELIALGDGRALFAAGDAATGQELWVTDGTAAGTALLKDIHAGPAGGTPYGFAALGGGRVLFSAHDGAHGRELWVTDGTAAGTAMVEDIQAGPFGSSPYSFTVLGDGRALFGANDASGRSELWVTDGTAAGTALLKDVEPGYNSGFAFYAFTPVVGGASWLDAAG